MNRRQRLVALLCASCALATPLSGNDALRMQVWPAIQRAPAVLTVRVSVEPSVDNRMLQIVAESSSYFRRSEVQMDGERSAALNVFEFRNLPTGLYQVTSVLIGPHGQRATATRVAKVEPATGR
jgi:hypothetical protein